MAPLLVSREKDMDWLVMSPWLLAGLFFVAVLAGFIDMLAGGGGLITIPALLAAGLPPTQALATNKLQSVGGSFSASLYFVRRGTVKLAGQKRNIVMTLLGSAAGALLIQHVRADLLRQLLPLLVIAIGLYFLLMPRLGAEDSKRRLALRPGGRRRRRVLRRFLWSGRRFVLRPGLCYAMRV